MDPGSALHSVRDDGREPTPHDEIILVILAHARIQGHPHKASSTPDLRCAPFRVTAREIGQG